METYAVPTSVPSAITDHLLGPVRRPGRQSQRHHQKPPPSEPARRPGQRLEIPEPERVGPGGEAFDEEARGMVTGHRTAGVVPQLDEVGLPGTVDEETGDHALIRHRAGQVGAAEDDGPAELADDGRDRGTDRGQIDVARRRGALLVEDLLVLRTEFEGGDAGNPAGALHDPNAPLEIVDPGEQVIREERATHRHYL